MPCEQGVAIPEIFRLVNLSRVYGAKKTARGHYEGMINQNRENNLPATACVECDECEPKCPQSIKIMEQLKEAHKLLTAKE